MSVIAASGSPDLSTIVWVEPSLSVPVKVMIAPTVAPRVVLNNRPLNSFSSPVRLPTVRVRIVGNGVDAGAAVHVGVVNPEETELGEGFGSAEPDSSCVI